MEKLRNRIDLRLVSYKKEYLTWTSKPNYMSQRIFDNDLVAIRNSKVILKFNRPAYVRICISLCTNSIMIILKINMVKNQDYYSLIVKRVVFLLKNVLGLKPKMYSFLADGSSESKKGKSVKRNIAVIISHSEFKDDVLLNNKYLRHSMNRI